MASGDIDVQVQGLFDLATKIDQQKSNMYQYISEVISTVNGVNWSGDARDAFDSAMSSMTQRFQNADGVLTSYVDFLNTAADNYIKNESTRATDNQSFEGGE